MDPALVSLLAASVAFVGSHFALSHPLRAPLVGALGENGFRILYSLVALATFIWAATAFRSVGAGGTPLWDGMSDAIWIVVTIIMLVASVLLAGSFVRNPALPDPRATRNAALPVHGVFHVTRHPMMWSFALWAAAHVLVSPTPRQWIMAGAIGFLALAGAHMQDRKKRAMMGDAWDDWQSRTSYWPRWGQFLSVGAVPLVAGTVLWLAGSYIHLWRAGIPAGRQRRGPW